MSVDLLKKSFLAGLGGGLAVLFLVYLSDFSGYSLIIAPFGASCVLLFALPESPLTQPKNVVGGHFLTTVVGLLALHCLPSALWVAALAVGVGIVVMMLTKTVHPPAGANPLLILLAGKVFPWSFLVFPVALGAALLVLVAIVFHATVTKSKYPVVPFFTRGK